MVVIAHFSNIRHRPFNPQCDSHLIIDLANLHPNTPMVHMSNDFSDVVDNGVPIPLFIAGPIIALRRILLEAERSFPCFLDDLPTDSEYKPIPMEPNCCVCQEVDWIFTQCLTLGQCLERFCYLPPKVVFEVLREFLRRMREPFMSYSFAYHMESQRCIYSYVHINESFVLPMDLRFEQLPLNWSQKREGIIEWTNGFLYLLHNDLQEHTVHRPVFSFIMVNLILLLRVFASILTVNVTEESNSWHYLMEAMRVDISGRLKTALEYLCKSLAHLLLSPMYKWLPRGSPPPPCEEPRLTHWYRFSVQKVMDTILGMNVDKVFYCPNLHSLIVHRPNCDKAPGLCYCRYLRRLSLHPE